MSIKSTRKRSVIQRAFRGRYTQTCIAKGMICKRQAKRWLTAMYNEGGLRDY